MGKDESKYVQLLFDFETDDRKVKFISVKGECRCGYSSEFRKADVVLEMTVPCPKCGSVIRIK